MKADTQFFVLNTDISKLAQRVYNGGKIESINAIGVMPFLKVKSVTTIDVRPIEIPNIDL